MILKTVERLEKIIPEFNGNKDLPENEQIIISIKHWPSVTEIANYKSFSFSRDGSTELKYHDALLLAACVGSIRNLSTDRGVLIRNGSDLASSDCRILSGLITEIRDLILADSEELESGESKA